METKQFELGLLLLRKQVASERTIAEGMLHKLVANPFDATFIEVLRSWPPRLQEAFIAIVSTAAKNDFRWAPIMTGGGIDEARFLAELRQVHSILSAAGLVE